jgi:PAS domain S-box-containing protein
MTKFLPAENKIDDGAAIAHSVAILQTQNADLQTELAQCRQELAQAKAANLPLNLAFSQSEAWRRAIDLNPISLWNWDLATGTFEWTEDHYRLLGYEPGAVEPSYQHWRDRLHPEDRDRVEATFVEAMQTGSAFRIDYRVVDLDGSIHAIVDRARWSHDSAGQPVRMLGVAIDMTERQAIEAAYDDLNHQLECHVQAQTQQLQASEASLHQREREFRTLAENSPDAIFRFDLAFRHLYLNPAAEKNMGLPRSVVLGKSDRELNMPAEAVVIWEQALEAVVQTRTLRTIEFSVPTYNGGQWFQSHTIPEFNRDGNLVSLLVLERDITTLKQTEAALRQSKQQLHRLAANIPGIIYQFRIGADGDYAFPYVSPQFEALFGISAAAVQQDAEIFINCCHPDDRASLEASISESFTRLNPWHWEGRFILSSEEVIWLQGASNPERQPNGDVLWDGILIDISAAKRLEAERLEAEQALRQSEEQFRAFFENSPIAIGLATLDDHYMVRSNAKYQELLGYSHSELCQMTFVDITHPNDIFADLTLFHQLLAGSISRFQIEKRYYRKNGDIIWVDLTVALVYDPEGKPLYSLCMPQDITEAKRLDAKRRQTEEALRRSQASLMEAQRVAHVGSWEVDLITQQGTWSAELFRLFGLDPDRPKPTMEEIIQLIHPDDRALYCQVIVQALEQGEPHALDHRLIRPDGSVAWIASLGQAERNPAGQMTRLFGVALDITDRKQAEASLRRSLQEKEMLLKEVHHRVKNNLQIVSSLLRMQSRKVENLQTFTVLQEAQNRVQSMALIHEQLYQSSDLTEIDLNEYLHSLVNNLFRSYGISYDQVALSIITHDTYLNLNAAISCGLIINELVSNSLKYAFSAEPFSTKPLGEIIISLTSVFDQPLNLSQVTLLVADNGVGIPATIDWKNAPSLGMRIVRNLVNQIKGEMKWLPGAGTAFEITFEIADEA